jgi:hypothetical protein
MKLRVAVRSAGHNVAGLATIDGGVMIHLSLIKGLFADAKGRTARAYGLERVQPRDAGPRAGHDRRRRVAYRHWRPDARRGLRGAQGPAARCRATYATSWRLSTDVPVRAPTS